MLTFSRIKKPAKPPSFASSVKEYFRRLSSVKQTRPAFVVVPSNDLRAVLLRPGLSLSGQMGSSSSPFCFRVLDFLNGRRPKGKVLVFAYTQACRLAAGLSRYAPLACHITIIPIAAAAITAAVNQPSQRNSGL